MSFIDPSSRLEHPINQLEIPGLTLEVLKEIDGITICRYSPPETVSGTPCFALPGIRNPKDGEFNPQVKDIIDAGASCVLYMQYSYEKPLNVDNVFAVINRYLDLYPNPNLFGISLGADIIASYLARFRDAQINKCLLISPNLIADNSTFLLTAFVQKIMSKFGVDNAYSRRLAEKITGGSVPPMAITNISHTLNIREQLLSSTQGQNIATNTSPVKVVWTKPEDEYATLAMRTNIEQLIQRTATNVTIMTEDLGPHGATFKNPDGYAKVITDWMKE